MVERTRNSPLRSVVLPPPPGISFCRLQAAPAGAAAIFVWVVPSCWQQFVRCARVAAERFTSARLRCRLVSPLRACLCLCVRGCIVIAIVHHRLIGQRFDARRLLEERNRSVRSVSHRLFFGDRPVGLHCRLRGFNPTSALRSLEKPVPLGEH